MVAKLDSNLDPTTIMPGDSSFPGTQFAFDPTTDTLTWVLPGINLPPDTNLLRAVKGSFHFQPVPKLTFQRGLSSGIRASLLRLQSAGCHSDLVRTIDGTPPTSQVLPLPPVENSTSFSVSWSGTDQGSGIATYDVYVSDNGGPFTPFLTDTTATLATFTGAFGHTYAFYSVATSNVGIVQPTPTVAQATTFLAGLPTSTVGPLPTTTTSPSFTVSWNGTPGPGATSIASYEIFVSDNGRPFTSFLTATTQTSATFTGQPGHTYSFFSVATDNLGSVQPTPAAAQATTHHDANPPPLPRRR